MALFSACSDTMHVYVPNTVNAPLLQEKNEVKGSLSLSNYQVAYGVTDHFGLMANGQYLVRPVNSQNSKGDQGIYDADARGGLFEVGAGYFNRFGRSRSKSKVFEVYGGYGRGGFRTTAYNFYFAPDSGTNNRRDYRVSSKFDKFFVQPGFGITHKVVEFSVASRFSLLHFNDIGFASKALEDDQLEREQLMRFDNKWVGTWEPAVTFKVGYKYVRFMTQLSFCVPFDRLPDADGSVGNDYGYYFQPVSVNLGVAFNFAKWLNDVR